MVEIGTLPQNIKQKEQKSQCHRAPALCSLRQDRNIFPGCCVCALYDQLKIMFCIIFWQRFVTANQVSPSQFRILFLFNMEFTFVQLANRQQYNVFSTKLSKFVSWGERDVWCFWKARCRSAGCANRSWLDVGRACRNDWCDREINFQYWTRRCQPGIWIHLSVVPFSGHRCQCNLLPGA